MDVKELNKSQLILLAILLSFVVSIATGITTVTLMDQAPSSVTIPITRIVKDTVDKIVPSTDTSLTPALSKDQQQLLEDLKAIKPLTVTLYLKGETKDKDKVLGTGLFLGDNRVVIASIIPEPAKDQVYIVKSVLGEQKILKLTQENDFTVVELVEPDQNNTTLIDKNSIDSTNTSNSLNPDNTQQLAP
jgi:hypothetical protein